MVRNVHFYLCFAFMELQDFNNAVKHGSHILREYWPKKQISKKTYFTVQQYLAEAYCMLHMHDKAQSCLNLAMQ